MWPVYQLAFEHSLRRFMFTKEFGLMLYVEDIAAEKAF